jgi:hypothetical protein
LFFGGTLINLARRNRIKATIFPLIGRPHQPRIWVSQKMKPQRIEQKWGFGMAPIKPEVQEKRKKSVRNVLNALISETNPDNLADSLSAVKGLFNRIHRQDQWDWFTVFEQLGCPGRIKSKQVAFNISELRKVCVGKSEKEDSEFFRNLNDLDLKRYLERFLDQRKDESESQKIYVLSTRESRTAEYKSVLKIGFTTRPVVERVNEINSSTGVVIPFGVRAVWCVKEAHQLEKKIHEKFSEFRIRKDREFFLMDFRDAFKSINRMIREERVKEL